MPFGTFARLRLVGYDVLATAVAGTVDQAPRVLRGGSFNNETSNVRCAVRNRNNPDNLNDNNGFRVGWASHCAAPRSGFTSRVVGSAGIAARLRLRCRGLEEKRDLFLAAPV